MSAVAFELLAYNVFLRPRYLLDGQRIRTRLLGELLANSEYDALVLCELFDRSCRTALLAQLEAQFPHRTPLVGASNRPLQLSGGVMVLSRWPIEDHQQRLFGSAASGFDRFGNKGVMYARIRKHGRPLHLLATHAQSGGDAASVRAEQLVIVRQLLDERSITTDEPVLFAGDFNVASNSSEYRAMLDALAATAPDHTGEPYSYDPTTNSLAGGRDRQLIDHILFSRDHLAPTTSTAAVLAPKCPPWRQFWPLCGHDDLSDHYPVVGRFSFA